MKVKDTRSRSRAGKEFSADENSTQYYHQDASTGEVHLEDVTDVTEMVETNVGQFNNYDERTPWNTAGAGFNKVASIPMGLYMEMKKKGVIDDPKALRRWLNDRDNLVFRTRPGVV